MPFADGAQSVAAKTKNINFVGEIPPGAEKTLQMLTFLPTLPPAEQKRT